MDGYSNRVRKTHSHHLESFAVKIRSKVEEDPIISFGPIDLKGVTTSHEDVLVIRSTIANYKVARVFINSGSSVNIFFKEAFD